MAKQAMPIAFVAPAGTYERQELIPSPRMNAQRDCIAVGTAISLRKNEVEEDRRGDSAKHEKAAEDERKDHEVRHDLLLSAH